MNPISLPLHCLSYVNQAQERSVTRTLLLPLKAPLQSWYPPVLQLGWMCSVHGQEKRLCAALH